MKHLRAWLERWIDDSPRRIAWHTPAGCVCYSNLGERVSATGSQLRKAGVEPGEVVALSVEEAADAALLMLSAMLSGIAVFPLDPRMPDSARERLLKKGGVEWLAQSVAGEWDFRRLRHGATVGDIADLRLLVATSGSSGEPRAVMLTERNLAASVEASAVRIPLRPDDRWYLCLPLFHIGGIAILLRALRSGCGVVFGGRFEERGTLTALEGDRVTHVSLVPTMLYRLVASRRSAPRSLSVALVGGAALGESLFHAARGLDWPLYVTYGMSECGSQVATWTPEQGEWAPGLAGKPLSGCQLSLLEGYGEDDENEGGVGRVRVVGPMVMAGYANPSRSMGEGLDRQGGFVSDDLGYLDREGRLRLAGRVGRVLKRGGEKISMADMEESITRHPGVNMAGIVVVRDGEWGEVALCIYRGAVGEAALAHWAEGRLGKPWRPHSYLRVERMPLLSNGKIDYVALSRLADEQDLSG